MALVAFAGGALAALLAIASRNSAGLRRWLPLCFVAVVALETSVLVGQHWPRINPVHHYPNTEAHAFMVNLGEGDRLAADGMTFYAATTVHWDIRTLTGRAFYPQSWREMLLKLDPEAFDLSQTFSMLDFSSQPQRMQSPILDAMAVRWIAMPLDAPVSGEQLLDVAVSPVAAVATGAAADASATEVTVPAGQPVSVTAEARPVRAVGIRLADSLTVADTVARVQITITADDGATRTAFRALRGHLPAGSY